MPPRRQVGLKLPEISLGLWHNFGGTAPLERSREIVRRAFEVAGGYGTAHRGRNVIERAFNGFNDSGA